MRSANVRSASAGNARFPRYAGAQGGGGDPLRPAQPLTRRPLVLPGATKAPPAASVSPSEPGKIRVRQRAAANDHPSELGATLQRGDVLAGVEQAGRVERPLDAAEALELRAGELRAHLVDLLDADAVLAGDRAADLDALLEHLAGELLGAMQLVRVVRVEQDQRVQVAVAGVEDVRAAQAVLALQFGDELQHRAEARARNRAVHAVVVGRDAAHRRERGLPAGPEPAALGFARRDAKPGRAGAAQHAAHARDLLLDLLRGAVRFAEEDRGRVEVVAGADELLDRARHRLVHHLEAGRDDAGADHRGHRVARLLDVVERGE